MALIIRNKRLIFNTEEIWFADYPYEVVGFHSVTFRACKNKIEMPGFYCEKFTTLTIDLKEDLDKIWSNFDKGSCKSSIKRAVREGVKIRLTQDCNQFYELNQAFRKNKGIPMGAETAEFMKKYGTLFTAELDGEIIGGQLYLEDEDNMRWLLGASKRLGTNREKAAIIGCGNRLMIWEAIKYAKAKRIQEFDLGGYYTGSVKDEQKEKINSFKQTFGGELTTHYVYRKEYSKLFSLVKHVYSLINSR